MFQGPLWMVAGGIAIGAMSIYVLTLFFSRYPVGQVCYWARVPILLPAGAREVLLHDCERMAPNWQRGEDGILSIPATPGECSYVCWDTRPVLVNSRTEHTTPIAFCPHCGIALDAPSAESTIRVTASS